MIAAPAPHRLSDEEIDRERWATCGPTALAGLLQRSLADVRPGFPEHTEERTWTNFSQMKRALTVLGAFWRETRIVNPEAHPPARAWPTRGLVIVQICGSWDALPIHHAAQLRRTHWIAVRPTRRGPAVFDGNAVGEAALAASAWWQGRSRWEREMLPRLVENCGKTATGAWWVRAALEVEEMRWATC
jgi:hypothetical protein